MLFRLGPIVLIFTIFCLIDAATTPKEQVRNLPKWAWILIIVFFDVFGSIAWLVAGHPWQQQSRRSVPWPTTRRAGYPEYERPRQVAPDDDPEFLRQLGRSNAEHEALLKQWEDDLRRREEHLKGPDDGIEGGGGPADRA